MKAIDVEKAVCPVAKRRRGMRGVSMLELLVVLVISSILLTISLPYVYNYKKRYKSEDQSLKIMDLMREAGQIASIKRRTIRFEIDTTDSMVLLIDENGAAPDTELKAIPIESVNELRMDVIPTGVTRPNPPNYTDAAFATDTTGHMRGSATITNHNVWAIRFNRDGSVVKTDGTLISATLYVWAPLVPGVPANTTPRNKDEVRAITIFGGSGAVRYWKFFNTAFLPY